jgi:hypothetical protein
MDVKIIFAILLWLTGVLFGFALAAWALYEPTVTGPAKYTWNHSPPAVPPYVMDGSKKLFTITCISDSEKDCPQAPVLPQATVLPPAIVFPPVTNIPEPGTLILMVVGLGILLIRRI